MANTHRQCKCLQYYDGASKSDACPECEAHWRCACGKDKQPIMRLCNDCLDSSQQSDTTERIRTLEAQLAQSDACNERLKRQFDDVMGQLAEAKAENAKLSAMVREGITFDDLGGDVIDVDGNTSDHWTSGEAASVHYYKAYMAMRSELAEEKRNNRVDLRKAPALWEANEHLSAQLAALKADLGRDVEAEREACADIAEKRFAHCYSSNPEANNSYDAGRAIAAAIRNRSNETRT